MHFSSGMFVLNWLSESATTSPSSLSVGGETSKNRDRKWKDLKWNRKLKSRKKENAQIEFSHGNFGMEIWLRDSFFKREATVAAAV